MLKISLFAGYLVDGLITGVGTGFWLRDKQCGSAREDGFVP